MCIYIISLSLSLFLSFSLSLYISVCVYIYIYIRFVCLLRSCVCLCVCVCVRARGRMPSLWVDRIRLSQMAVTIPVKSTGQVTILWTMQLTSETPLENVTEGRAGRRLTHGTTTQQQRQTFNLCKLVTWFCLPDGRDAAHLHDALHPRGHALLDGQRGATQ